MSISPNDINDSSMEQQTFQMSDNPLSSTVAGKSGLTTAKLDSTDKLMKKCRNGTYMRGITQDDKGVCWCHAVGKKVS